MEKVTDEIYGPQGFTRRRTDAASKSSLSERRKQNWNTPKSRLFRFAFLLPWGDGGCESQPSSSRLYGGAPSSHNHQERSCRVDSRLFGST